MDPKDRYKKRIGNFYNFEITEDKFESLRKMARQRHIKNFRKAIFLGMFFEALVIKTPICRHV